MSVNQITNAQILVTEFDTECSKPQPAAEYRQAKQRVKRGGTDFRPVFALADSLKVPLLVIFTDGDGSAPEHAADADQHRGAFNEPGALRPAAT
jgi:predicted metal-dependent peptidase